MRSGKYSQCEGELRSLKTIHKKGKPSYAYCGIGLAYQLLVASGEWTVSCDDDIWNIVQEAYGLNVEDLAEMNDNGFTFEKLADMIEEGLLNHVIEKDGLTYSKHNCVITL